MVKHKQKPRQTVLDVFKVVLEVERRVVERSFVDRKHERQERFNNPLLRELHSCYTSWAFEKMLYKFRESHAMKV